MTQLIEAFENFFANALQSDFFAGGLALGAFGVVAAFLRTVYLALHRLASRRLCASVTLDNRKAAYRHFCLWMDHNNVLAHARHVRLLDGRWSDGTKGYAPSPGGHWFIADRKLCRLERHLDEKVKTGDHHCTGPLERITVTVFFSKVDRMMGWIADGKRIAAKQDRRGPALHRYTDGYWNETSSVCGRSIETVLADDDRLKDVLDDMRWFYSAQDWYTQRGVPWRRGYLLFGPPGTGKSSLVQALASELSIDIATLDVGRPGLRDDDLSDALVSAPERCLIAIEDIDAIFTQRDSKKESSGVSFSGLLNAIDGVAAQEGRALIMTTNHIEKLDPALIRPGRADVHVEMGLIGAPAARKLFERFFPGQPDLAVGFENRLAGQRLSPAKVQGWLLSNCNDAKVAAAACGLLEKVNVPVAAE